MSRRKKKDELYYVMNESGIVETARDKGWDLPPENACDVFERFCEYIDAITDEWFSDEDNLSEYASRIETATTDTTHHLEQM